MKPIERPALPWLTACTWNIFKTSGRSSLDEVRSALEGEDINFGVARADALTLTSVEYEGLDFTPSSSSVLSERVDECAFSADLRRGFYTALQD